MGLEFTSKMRVKFKYFLEKMRWKGQNYRVPGYLWISLVTYQQLNNMCLVQLYILLIPLILLNTLLSYYLTILLSYFLTNLLSYFPTIPLILLNTLLSYYLTILLSFFLTNLLSYFPTIPLILLNILLSYYPTILLSYFLTNLLSYFIISLINFF